MRRKCVVHEVTEIDVVVRVVRCRKRPAWRKIDGGERQTGRETKTPTDRQKERITADKKCD